MSKIYVTIGLTKGQTLLPLPPPEILTNDSMQSKDKAHNLEGYVITWIKQIKAVLKLETESLFKDGRNPTPID